MNSGLPSSSSLQLPSGKTSSSLIVPSGVAAPNASAPLTVTYALISSFGSNRFIRTTSPSRTPPSDSASPACASSCSAHTSSAPRPPYTLSRVSSSSRQDPARDRQATHPRASPLSSTSSARTRDTTRPIRASLSPRQSKLKVHVLLQHLLDPTTLAEPPRPRLLLLRRLLAPPAPHPPPHR